MSELFSDEEEVADDKDLCGVIIFVFIRFMLFSEAPLLLRLELFEFKFELIKDFETVVAIEVAAAIAALFVVVVVVINGGLVNADVWFIRILS